jgi:hypothetical protein
MTNIRNEAHRAFKLVADAGGEIVGRTRIQKIGFFLEALGEGDGFSFGYKHYGPFSEDLSLGLKYARIFGTVIEVERPTEWGGFYSVYSANGDAPGAPSELRSQAIHLGKEADPVDLELAATAAFLALRGEPDPWRETARRKPDKATSSRLKSAKALYSRFRSLAEERLPAI